MEPIRRLARHPVVKQQGKFFVVGVICTVIDFGIFDALTYRWHLAPVVAHTVSFVFSCVASFVLNRIWTFELEGRVDWMREGVPFLLFSLLGWGLQALAIVLAERRFGNGVVVLNAAKVAGVGAIWLLKFFVYRNMVFVDRRPRRDEEDVGLIEAEASYPGIRPPRAASR